MKKQILTWLITAGTVLAALVAILAIALTRPVNRIGICYRDNTAGENKIARAVLEKTLAERGYQVITLDADGDQARQIEQIGQLQKKKCKGLLIEPVMSSAAAELLAAVDAAGLPTVLFGRAVEERLLQQYPRIAWVGPDMTQPGAIQGQILAGLPQGGDLNGDGTVAYLVLQGPQEHISAAAGVQALQQTLADTSAQCLSVQYGDWSQDSGRRLCKQELAAYGKDIEVVFCGSDSISRGALEAIDDGGRTVGTDIYLIGIGKDKTPAEQGDYTALVWLDTELAAGAVCDRLLALLAGTPGRQITEVPYTVVTKQ